MSDVTDVRVWPCTFEAVAWSDDGIIAISAEESVELLFPTPDFSDTEQKEVAWQHVALRVPWFNTEELPDKEPAPITTYSVGEEISTSIPISIAWSPPGLAKHRRCALAALTSNLVLSIWASDGRHHEAQSWDRRIILNNALAEYFDPPGNEANAASTEESVLVTDIAEKVRLRTRIRAFAWAHGLPNADPHGIVGTQIKWGQYILALSNDDNQVVFVMVDSPTSTFGAEDEWTADVLDHFTVTPDAEKIFSAPSTFDDIIKQQRYISDIAWSPWIIQGEWYHSVLAYATNDDVRARLITYKHDTIGVGDEIVYSNSSLSKKGAMKWSPQVHNDRLELALFSADGLTILTISATYATVLDRQEHNLENRWEETTGAVWDQSELQKPRLHFSSTNLTAADKTAAVELSADGLMALPSPNWYEQIADMQALFSAQNDLQGNVKSKVWGLSVSPLGDFVVSCHTVHPSDMLEYNPAKERYCTVAINHFKGFGEVASLEFPVKSVTAEGIAFTLRKWVENTVESTEHIAAFQDAVMAKLVKAYTPTEGPQCSEIAPSFYKSNKISDLTAEFKRNVYLNPHTLKDRYTHLTTHLISPKTPLALPKTLVAYRLALYTTSLPPLHTTPFSTEILSSHHQLITLINTVVENSSSSHPSPIPTNPHVLDSCDFCAASIPFEDLDTARCTNGHEFPRCGLSFLAVQAPRITKNCAVCGVVVLGEEFVRAQEEGGGEETMDGQAGVGEGEREREAGEDEERTESRDVTMGEGGDGEKPVSLAMLLFWSCDVCIYCGGKYTG